jgi:peptide/nickel transport system substrate-binding protein
MRSRWFSRVLRFFAVASLAGVVLFGATAGASTHSVAKPKKGGVFTILFNTEPPGADVLQLREIPNISPGLMASAIYDELVWTNPTNLKLMPKIATSITTADKGLTWTIKLHSGVTFSDGTPFDATAVQFNWQRIADPANKAVFGGVARKISTYSVVDAETLKVTLGTADPIFDQEIARNLAWIGSPTAIKNLGATVFSTKPIGAGPFLLKEWVRGVSQTYVRNPTYWQKGKPYVDEMDMKFVSDDTARFNTLSTGAAHAALDGSFTNISQYEASGKYNLTNTPAFGGGNSFGMNMSKPPFDDLRVRQAMALTLDSKEFVQRTGDGDDTWVIRTVDEKTSPFYNAKLKLPKQDIPGAQKLIDAYIAEHGGKPIEFTYLALNVPNHIRAANAFQTMITSKLKNVTMKIDTQEPATGVGRIAAGDFQAYFAGDRWTDPRLDMPQYFQQGGTSNYHKYTNPAVESAMTQLLNTTDTKVIKDAENTVIQNVLKDLPVVWVQRFRVYFASSKASLKGFNIFYELRPIVEDVWLAKPTG